MRNKAIRRFFCGVGVFVVLACLFCLWYTWPVPYGDLVPEGAECQEITIDAYTFLGEIDNATQDYHATLTPEDPVFGQLLSLIQGQSYRHHLDNLFRSRYGHGGSFDPGDFSWSLDLHYDVPQQDGTIQKKVLEISGGQYEGGEPHGETYVRIIIHDDPFISDEYEDWYATVDDQQQWLTDMMDVIRQLPMVSE